ncbi:hypothetical protein [Kordia sp.]|uniref:hypothetical protein n=1 Tax=Kordia sp. TaxID=1965332 RepID=UPI003D6C1728
MRKVLQILVVTGVLLISGIFVELPIWLSASILSMLFIVVLYSELGTLNHKAKGELVLRTNGRKIKTVPYILGLPFLGYFIYRLYMGDISGSNFFFLVFPMHLLIQTIVHVVRKKYKPIIFAIDGNTLLYYSFNVKKYDVDILNILRFAPRGDRLQVGFDDGSSLVIEARDYDTTEFIDFFETLTKKSERNFKFINEVTKEFPK